MPGQPAKVEAKAPEGAGTSAPADARRAENGGGGKEGGTTGKKEEETIAVVAFKKKDFPELGKETKEGKDEDEDDDEAGDEPLIPLPKRPEPVPEPEEERSSVAELQAAPTPRLLFNNPSHGAPPVSAAAVRSSLMNARDVCYVVHSYMRPLHSLDAYNDDYYRWGYDDRKSRNLLVLGGGGGGGGAAAAAANLPKPVWKEEKIKAREMETKYREAVETRARDWGEKRQVLGRVAKVNVRRPRALLAAPGGDDGGAGGALTTRSRLNEEGENNASADGDAEESPESSPEERTRARLWSARLAIDRGYASYLSLVELRRLLQSNDQSEVARGGRRREELEADVEDGIAGLHSALGVKVTVVAPAEEEEEGKGEGEKRAAGATGATGASRRVIEVDRPVLARTLSLPKGRMLLGRVLDEAVLPHSSARRVLPAALEAVLRSPPTEGGVAAGVGGGSAGGGGGAPPRGEDRMLRSLSGLVRTVRPSVSPRDLLDCLDAVREVHSDFAEGSKKEEEGKKGDDGGGGGGGAIVKSMLGGQRTRMELLHAVLTRGNEICLGPPDGAGGEYGEEWRRKEAEFMAVLSGAAAAQGQRR